MKEAMTKTHNISWYISLMGIMTLLVILSGGLLQTVGCGKAEEVSSKYKSDNNPWERTNLRCIAGYEFVTYTRSEGAGITQVLNANGGGIPCQIEKEKP
jgi:hypothetical protein